MKIAQFFLVVLIATLISPLTLDAQVSQCFMYTYSDQWTDDESDSLLALNRTDADACGDYSVTSNVEIRMPSGYSQSASAVGWTAESIALAPVSGESGDGVIFGSNYASYSCSLLSSLFSLNTTFRHVTHMKTGVGQKCYTGPAPLKIQYCWYPVQPRCPNPPPYSFTDNEIKETKSMGDTVWGWVVWNACLYFPGGGRLCLPEIGIPQHVDPNIVCDTR